LRSAWVRAQAEQVVEGLMLLRTEPEMPEVGLTEAEVEVAFYKTR